MAESVKDLIEGVRDARNKNLNAVSKRNYDKDTGLSHLDAASSALSEIISNELNLYLMADGDHNDALKQLIGEVKYAVKELDSLIHDIQNGKIEGPDEVKNRKKKVSSVTKTIEAHLDNFGFRSNEDSPEPEAEKSQETEQAAPSGQDDSGEADSAEDRQPQQQPQQTTQAAQADLIGNDDVNQDDFQKVRRHIRPKFSAGELTVDKIRDLGINAAEDKSGNPVLTNQMVLAVGYNAHKTHGHSRMKELVNKLLRDEEMRYNRNMIIVSDKHHNDHKAGVSYFWIMPKYHYDFMAHESMTPNFKITNWSVVSNEEVIN